MKKNCGKIKMIKILKLPVSLSVLNYPWGTVRIR
jgi:hypothetical protein